MTRKEKIKTCISIEKETEQYISDIQLVYGCKNRSDVIDKVVQRFYKDYKDDLEDTRKVMESLKRKNPFD